MWSINLDFQGQVDFITRIINHLSEFLKLRDTPPNTSIPSTQSLTSCCSSIQRLMPQLDTSASQPQYAPSSLLTFARPPLLT
jgi:hypothetical protein